MYGRLPTELWTFVVRTLPHDDQRNCLFVSKQLHDIALFFLFSKVTLYFGLWESDPFYDRWSVEPWDKEDIQAVETRANITWELLRHISRTPSFATIVKKVSVRAYAKGDRFFENRELSLDSEIPLLIAHFASCNA